MYEPRCLVSHRTDGADVCSYSLNIISHGFRALMAESVCTPAFLLEYNIEEWT